MKVSQAYEKRWIKKEYSVLDENLSPVDWCSGFSVLDQQGETQLVRMYMHACIEMHICMHIWI